MCVGACSTWRHVPLGGQIGAWIGVGLAPGDVPTGGMHVYGLWDEEERCEWYMRAACAHAVGLTQVCVGRHTERESVIYVRRLERLMHDGVGGGAVLCRAYSIVL